MTDPLLTLLALSAFLNPVTRRSRKKQGKMTTKNPDPVIEKDTSFHHEKAELEPVKPAAGGNVDYTGSVAKTDPREIELVRTIDWRLMVCE